MGILFFVWFFLASMVAWTVCDGWSGQDVPQECSSTPLTRNPQNISIGIYIAPTLLLSTCWSQEKLVAWMLVKKQLWPEIVSNLLLLSADGIPSQSIVRQKDIKEVICAKIIFRLVKF